MKKTAKSEAKNELRSEYDFSKLKAAPRLKQPRLSLGQIAKVRQSAEKLKHKIDPKSD